MAFESVVDVLVRRVADEPDRGAYLFLDQDLGEKDRLSCRELDERSRALAAHLLDRCEPGDRVVLAFPPGLDFVVSFFACLRCELIAVPIQPPRRGRVRDGLRAIVHDARPSLVLTTEALGPVFGAGDDFPGPPLPWLAVDHRALERVAPVPVRATDPERLAMLQYTSGSTSAPKGVMVTHGNLAANQEMIRHAFGHDRSSTVLGWLPLHHDQGLIGNVLQPLWVGATSILMSPTAFARRPASWLLAIDRYRVHSSGGPNFAYDLCCERVPPAVLDEVDLSCWQVAFNGAEPIRADTLERFTERFGPAGFRSSSLLPCYGLAESTLIVTGSGRGRGARRVDVDLSALEQGRGIAVSRGGGRALVGSGSPPPRGEVLIVEPATGARCAPGTVGEIRVAGPHVAAGYWNDRERTADTFRVEGERTFLCTGDLGMILDGELFVVGRMKDLMIVHGRNLYPHDVERTVERAHPVLRSGTAAAFLSDDAGVAPSVSVAVEVDRAYEGDDADVVRAVREAVASEHDLSLAEVALLAVGGALRTTSGKIMRSATRAALARNALSLRSSPTPAGT